MRHTLIMLTVLMCFSTTKAQNYDIAPLDFNLANGAQWESTGGKSYGGTVWNLVKKQTSAKPVPDKKEKGKRKKQAEQTMPVVSYGYEAKLTGEKYDPNEVLSHGFTISLWAVPFASPAPEHGFVLYPLQGRIQNGINQSQWGITVGKDCIRVYERYSDNALILEYRHSEKADFFIALTCKNRTPTLYINGAAVSTGTPSPHSPHPALEGTASCPASMKFIGKSTQLHYFPRVLTDKEITGLYKTEYNELHRTK